MQKVILPLAIFTLAGAILVHSLPQAEAVAPAATVTCAVFVAGEGVQKGEAFMSQQLHIGRTHFESLPHPGAPTWLCAW